ncbi:peroxiredoxin, partial [Patescibacteria group bacterium]|nr:peroxiredoxin [Patescibacteria group bacterium]
IKVNLKDFDGKWLIFFFYPRDFTFVCPTELRAFAKNNEAFKKLGAEILAASTDSEWSHKAWFEKDLPEVNYPVIADTTQSIARDYDVLNEDDGSSERGLFIIDPEGIVRYSLISSGSVGRSVEETLRVLKALQSGDLCPIDWEPGEETLGKA